MPRSSLTTARLALEPIAPEHSDGIVRVFAEPSTSEYLRVPLHDEAAARAMVERRLSFQGPPEFGTWTFLHEGQVVGIGHLVNSRELSPSLVEIGWFLDPLFGGQGLATEAVEAIVKYALDRIDLPALWALVHVENAPSLRLAQRVGFLPVGVGDHYGAPHRVHVRLP